jgi:hypothetical protein
MTPDQFFARLTQDNSREPGTHVLESGLADAELISWQKCHPGLMLPPDFVKLLRQHNGFRLLPDENTPTGAIRLLPLREIDFAPRIIYEGNTVLDSDFPKSWMTITDDPDSARFLILDTSHGHYLEIDPIDPSEPEVVANNVEEMLDWMSQFLESAIG